MAARSGGGSLLPPGQPFCVEVGTDSLAIGWDAPVPLQPDLLLGYKVMVQAGGTNGFVDVKPRPTLSNTGTAKPVAQVRGLAPNSWYEFRVATITTLGMGALSAASQPILTAGLRGQKAAVGAAPSAQGGRAAPEEYVEAKAALLLWERAFAAEHGRPAGEHDRATNPDYMERLRQFKEVRLS